MTRVGVITQARMTSTRLPGKVLMQAGGTSMLGHHVRRLQVAGFDVCVATTANMSDDPIAVEGEHLGCSIFRGSEDDVLGRFVEAARYHDFDVVVRVTSDCPLIDGEIVRTGVETFLQAGDPELFVSNTLDRTFPRGMDFEVFAASELLRADRNAVAAEDREHVTPSIYRRARTAAKVRQITRGGDASRLRLTLDTVEDLTLMRRLFDEHSAASLDAEQLIALLAQHPELVAINAGVEQKKLRESR